MKRILSYLFFILMASQLHAQIDFTILKKNVECNDANPGSVEINVVSTDPPYTYLWNTGDADNVIEDIGIGTYSCTVTDGSGDDTLVVVYVGRNDCVMKPGLVITPNGDGVHDTWYIDNSEFYPDARVIVFNRLGQKVFEQSGTYEPWDARDLLGRTLPDASYYYVIYHKSSDETTIIKGAVTILR